MKAIETVFDGYRFRSRLEARWATFFKTLGIEYQYEVEGFDLDGVPYLPDFWFPGLDCWIEIKGQTPTSQELAKVEALESATGYPACLFYGLPGDNDGYAYFTCSHESNGGKSFSNEVAWRRCPVCNTIGLNLRHDDECHLYSEVHGINLKGPSCGCTIEDFKAYHRKRIYAGGPGQLRSKLQWQQYRKKPYEEYEEPTEEEFKDAAEQFIVELVNDIYPRGVAVAGVARTFHGHFDGFSNACTAARQARFEFGR